MCLRAEISPAHPKKTPSFTYTKCLPAVPSCPFSGWFKGRGAQLAPGGGASVTALIVDAGVQEQRGSVCHKVTSLRAENRREKGRVAPPHPKNPQRRPSPHPYYQSTALLSCCRHSRCHICHVAQGSTATIVKEVGRWARWGEDEERDGALGVRGGGSAARRDMGILRNVLRARGISILDGAEWGRLFLFLWLPERLH